MLSRHLILIAFVSFYLGLAPASLGQDSSSFVIEDIRVEGVERLDTGIIFRNLDLKIGDEFDSRQSGRVINSLFRTGVLQDVELRRDGNVLVIKVVENPTITEIGFSGMDELQEEQALQGLEELNVIKSGVLRSDGVERATRFLQDAYFERAFYAVDIQPTVTPLERNRVRIDFEIREGEPVKVGEVVLYGVEAEDPEEVLEQMTIQPTNWLSWYNRDDVYSNSVLLGDVERIRDYYLARGHLRFDVRSTEVELSRERDSMRIVIVVDEGSSYTLSGWELSGEHKIDEETDGLDLGLVVGETYSAHKVERAAQEIRKHLGNQSFARAKVTPKRIYDDENNSAAVNFVIEPGKPVYVRRINISGNYKTRDEVIRRELRQFESSLYSAEKIEQSRRRLNRLGFFDSVDFEEVEVEESEDELDLELEVAESSIGTGSVGFGLGFSRSGGVSFTGSFETNNIFGTGNDFGAAVSFSDTSDRFSLDFDQPYITEYGVSRHIGISRSSLKSSDDITDFRLEGTDFDYGYGFPVGEETVLFANVHYETDRLLNSEFVSEDDEDAQRFLERHGEKSTSYLASASLTRDTRDSIIAPTDGYRQSFSARSTLPFGDLRYYTLRVLHEHYLSIDEDEEYTLGMLGEASYADALGSYEYPLYKRFFLGGPASLRGFDAGTVGPKDEEGDGLGGRVRIRGNIDFYVPFPLISEFEGVRTSFFTDVGALYTDPSDFNVDDFRMSAGITIRWLSPLGPFKFILAQPLRSKENDRTRLFDFTLGVF